jgi:hypothetical protein
MKPPARGHLRLVSGASPARSFREVSAHSAAIRATSPCSAVLIGTPGDARGYALHVATGELASVELALRGDRRVSASLRSRAGRDALGYELGAEGRHTGPARIVPAVTKLLGAMGIALGGFDVELECDARVGAGEAAMGVALLRALRDGFALALPDGCLGLVAHHASAWNGGAALDASEAAAAAVVQVRAAVLTGRGVAEWPSVALPQDVELAAIAAGSRAPLAFADGRRRGDAARGAAALHFLSESLRAVHALEDIERWRPWRLGALLETAERSAREYQRGATDPDAILIADIARQDPDVFGARVSPAAAAIVLILAKRSSVRQACARVARAFARRAARVPSVLLPQAGHDRVRGGTRLIPP